MDKRVEEFRYESARCTVVISGDRGLVSHVYSKIRGQGHATGLLTRVIEFADKNGLELHLVARGYGGPVQTMLNPDQLVRFYKKFGFIDQGDGCAVNTPMIRTKNTPYNEREDFR